MVPLHVSGLWVPHYARDPVRAGSVGAGLNLALYLTGLTTLGGPCKIYYNGHDVLREQAAQVCAEVGLSVTTEVHSPVELGHGFGASAGAIIAHSVGANAIAGRTFLGALRRAHILEVSFRTGLGDVIAEYTGGFAVRVRPGAPGVGLAYRLCPRGAAELVVADLGPGEPTKAMLSRMGPRLYELGRGLLKEVVEGEDLATFFEASRRFTGELFDYGVAQRALGGLRGVVSYYLKKSALVIWVEREYVGEVLEGLRSRGVRAYRTTVSQVGVTLAHTA